MEYIWGHGKPQERPNSSDQLSHDAHRALVRMRRPR
jgi:hypothetical protein